MTDRSSLAACRCFPTWRQQLARLSLFAATLITAQTPALASDVMLADKLDTTRVAMAAKSAAVVTQVEGLTVLSYDGVYDRGNMESRAGLSSTYFAGNQDDVDLLITFTDFDFDTGDASAFANIVKNDTRGIGMPLTDQSTAFGSGSGRLQTYIDMAMLDRWEWRPADAAYSRLLDVAIHELMHRWTARPLVMREGIATNALLGRDQAHWNFFLDTNASVMYGARWEAGTNGRFEATEVRRRLSNLDLYLAGFLAASEVGPIQLIENGEGAAPTDLPELGFQTPGQLRTFSIDDVVAANGIREPGVAASPKQLTAGLMLVLRPGQGLRADAPARLWRFARDLEQRFAAMTRGRASLAIRNLPRHPVSSVVPEPLTGSAPCSNCPFSATRSAAWLRDKQQVDDGWTDKATTRIQATASAIQALASFQGGGYGRLYQARIFLRDAPSRQFEDLRWKSGVVLEAPSAGDAALSQQLGERDRFGEVGLSDWFERSPWDVATAMGAGQASATSEQIASLLAMQNPDGSFGVAAGGRGHVATTAYVASRLHWVQGDAIAAIRSSAIAWLRTQLQPNGALPGDADGIASAWLLPGLVGMPEAAITHQYLEGLQRLDGDFSGSVLTTAEVMQALQIGSAPNLRFDWSDMGTIPAQPHAGDDVRLVVQVINDGNAHARGTSLQWRDGDTALGGPVPLPPLDPGETIRVERTWSTLGLSGARQITAEIDPENQEPELNETDNRLSKSITVASVEGLVDAGFATGSFTFEPTTINSYPQQVVVSGRVRNLGGLALTQLPVALYALRSGQRVERARQTLDLAAQSEVEVSLAYDMQAEDAAYIVLVVDPENAIAEFREDNNELNLPIPRDQNVDIELLAADLVLRNPPAQLGQPAEVSITVRNRGALASGNFELRPTLTYADLTQTLDPIVVQLASGAETTRTVRFIAQRLGATTLTVEAVGGNVPPEANPDNQRASLTFDVLDPTSPNLSVDAAYLVTDPAPLDQGSVGALSGIVRNTGSAFATPVRIDALVGSTLTASRSLGSIVLAEGMAAGSQRAITIPLAELQEFGAQNLFLSVDADAAIAESNESDNVAFKAVVIRSLPDLALTTASIRLTPSVPVDGQTVRAALQVRNLGAQAALGVELRLYAGEAAAGQLLGTPVLFDRIEGFATVSAEVSWTRTALPAIRQVTLVADPLGSVREGREDNNVAIRLLQETAANFATEPYFSPNGDGVRDTTDLVFSALSAAVAEVLVSDAADHVVRRFGPEAITAGSSSGVTWDGLTDEGRRARDGEYRVQAMAATGEPLASVRVVLDTDRSSFVEAVGTQFELRASMPDSLGWVAPSPLASARAPIVVRDPIDPQDPHHERRLHGWFRVDPLLNTFDVIVDHAWAEANGGGLWSASIVADGKWLIFTTRATPGQLRLWRASLLATSSAPMALGQVEDIFQDFHDLGGGRVLLWQGGDSVRAVVVDAQSGARTNLRTEGVRGDLLRIDSGRLIVGKSRGTELHVVALDPGVAAKVVLADAEEAEVRSVSASGALVHRWDGGRERFEWRPLGDGAVLPVAERAAAGSCSMASKADGLQQQAVVVDYAGKRLHLVDMSTGATRQFPQPTLFEHQGYASEFLATTESESGTQALLHFDHVVDGREWPCEYAAPDDDLWVSPDQVVVGFSQTILSQEGWAIPGVREYVRIDVAPGELTRLGGDLGRSDSNGNNWPLAVAEDIERYQSLDIETTLDVLDWRLRAKEHFADGSGIGAANELWADARIRVGTDGDPVSLSEPNWARQQAFLVSAPSGARSTRISGANDLAALRVRSRQGALELTSVAMDRNLESWEVEWTRADQNGAWHPIGGAVSEPGQGELMYWAAPEPGDYRLRLTVRDRAGNSAWSEARAMVMQGADITDVVMTPSYVSPNGDGVKDTVDIAYTVLRPTTVALEVRDAGGQVVFREPVEHADAGRVERHWDGRGNDGQRVPEGEYRVALGPWFARNVVLDVTPPSLVRGSREVVEIETPVLSTRQGRVLHPTGGYEQQLRWTPSDLNQGQTRLGSADGGSIRVPTLNSSREWSASLDTEGDLRVIEQDLAGNVSAAAFPEPAPDLWVIKYWTESGVVALEEHQFPECDFTPPELEDDNCFEWNQVASAESGQLAIVDVAVPTYAEARSLGALIEMDGRPPRAARVVSVLQHWRGWRLVIDPEFTDRPENFSVSITAESNAGPIQSEWLSYPLRGMISNFGMLPFPDGLHWDCAHDLYPDAGAGLVRAGESLLVGCEQFDGIDYAPRLNGWVFDDSDPFRPNHKRPLEAGDVRLFQVRDGRWLWALSVRCDRLEVFARDQWGREHWRPFECPRAPAILDVEPIVQECGVQAAEQVRVNAGIGVPYERRLTRFRVQRVSRDGEALTLFDESQAFVDDLPCAEMPFCLRDALFHDEVSTQDLEDGVHFIETTAYFDLGAPYRFRVPLPVSRSLPSIEILHPLEGQRECIFGSPGKLRGPSFRVEQPNGFALSARMRWPQSPDAGPRWMGWMYSKDPDPRPGVPAQSVFWTGMPEAPWSDSDGSFYRAVHYISPEVADPWLPWGVSRMTYRRLDPDSDATPPWIYLESEDFPEAWSTIDDLSGPMSLDLRAVGWSGAQVCRSVSFLADANLDAEFISSHSTTQYSLLMVTGDDRDFFHVINPTGQPEYQFVDVELEFREPANLRIEYLASGDGPALRLAEVSVGQENGVTPFSYRWNGRLEDGSPVPDGNGLLRFVASDSCGHETEFDIGVRVDTTAPEIEIYAPQPDATAYSLLVPIAFFVADESLGEAVVRVIDQSAQASLIMSSGFFGPPIDRPFLWNRGDLSGPVVMQFHAVDAVGNQSTVDMPVNLAPRTVSLIADASATPRVFSPNGDGRFDGTRFEYALAQAAAVDIRVKSPGGTVLTTLVSNEPKPQGAFQFDWDGTGLPLPLQSGVVHLELTAHSALDPLVTETVAVPVEIDLTAPVGRLLSPSAAYSQGTGSLELELIERNFGSAQWQLGDRSGALGQAGRATLLAQEDLPEGQHTLNLVADDVVANHAEASFAFTIDRTPPVAAIDAPTAGAVIGGVLTEFAIVGSATDLNFERAELELRQSGGTGAWERLALLEQPVDAANLANLSLLRPEAAHQLRLRVRDRAGHEAEVLRNFEIDRTPPVVVLTAPVDGTVVSNRLLVTGSVGDAHLTDYHLRIATQAMADLGHFTDIAANTQAVEDGVLFDVPFAVEDDDYFIEVVARDAVGLETVVRRRVSRDTTPPQTPLQLVATRQGSTDVLLNWTASDSPDLAGYVLYRDGVRLNTDLIVGTQHTDLDVPDGRIGYRVTAVDHAGNESAPSNRAEVVIDRQPPLAVIQSPGEAAIVAGLVDVIGTAHSEDDFDRYRLYLEGPLPGTSRSLLLESTNPVQGAVLASWDSRAAAEGDHYRFVLEAEDTRGNQATAAVAIEVDNLPPATPTGLVATPIGGNDATVSWNPNSEPDLLGYVLLRDGNPVNASSLPQDLRDIAIPATTYPQPGLPDGRHEWLVFAIDRAGNLSGPSEPADLVFSGRPPEVRIVSPQSGTEFTTVIVISAESDDEDVVEVRFSQRRQGEPDWIPIGSPVAARPYRVEWDASALPFAVYEVRAEARDSEGLEDPTPPQVDVRRVDRTPPGTVPTLSATALGGDVNLQWSAVADADLAHYRVQRRWCADCTEWQDIAEVPAGTVAHVDQDRPDGRYEYRVLAVDAHENVGEPSASDDAVVFTIVVPTPYSPIRTETVELRVSTPRAGVLGGQQQDAGGTRAFGPVALPEGNDQALAGVAVVMGRTRFDLSLEDAQSNRSRAATVQVLRGAPPSTPTGLALAAAGHEVTASWNANPEPDVVGYRLWYRDQALLGETAIADVESVDSEGDSEGPFATDGDPQTGWMHHTSYWSQDHVERHVLILSLPSARWVSGMSLDWMEGRVPQRYRIEAYTEIGYVPLQRVERPQDAQHLLQFATPYYTTQLRLVVEQVVALGPSVSLAEVRLREHPLIPATNFTNSVLDGHHPYRVSAVNALGFESERSPEASIDIGDTVAPDAVVLSGETLGQEARLSWTASTAPDVAIYRLMRDGEHRTTVPSSVLDFVDAPRPNGSDTYVVYAEDAFGNRSAASNEVTLSFGGAGPGVPRDPAVTALPEGEALRVTWRAGDGTPPVRYRVRRALAETGPWAQIAELPQTELVDRGLTNDTRYWYTIQAIDAAGNESGETDPVSGVPVGIAAPQLRSPVRGGESAGIRRDRVLVAGVAHPGVTVRVRRNDQSIGTVSALADAVMRGFDDSYLHGRIQSSPSGAWVFGGDAPDAVFGLPEPNAAPEAARTLVNLSTTGAAVGWTDDDLLVTHAGGEPQLRLHQLPELTARGSIELPLSWIGRVAVDSALQHALVEGDADVNGTPTTGWWIVEIESGALHAIVGEGFDSLMIETVDFAEALGLLAARGPDGSIWRIDVASGAAVRIAEQSANFDIDLDERSGRLLWASDEGAAMSIRHTRLDGTTVVVGIGNAAAWVDEGASIAVAGLDARISVRDAESLLEQRAFAAPIEFVSRLEGARAGRLLLADDSGRLGLRDEAGSWRAPELAMLDGVNELTAVAVDAQGRSSLPSTRGDLVRAVTAKPDLSISTAEIHAMPEAGALGTAFTVFATVRNLGAVRANASTLSWELMQPDGQTQRLDPPATLPALEPGASVLLSRGLGIPQRIGACRVTARADAAQAVAESNELNNAASTSLLVSATSAPVLELVLDSTGFAPGGDVTGSARVTNAGAVFSGALALSAVDSSGRLLTSLGSTTIRDLGPGQQLAVPVLWDSPAVAAGSYAIRADLADHAGQPVAERVAAFEIRAVRDLQLGIQPVQPSIVVGAAASSRSTLHFRSGNAPIVAATLVTRLLSPDGSVVQTRNRALTTLLPGYRIQLPESWEPVSVAGVYGLRVELIEAGVPLARASSSLQIVDATGGVSLVGSIAPNPAVPVAGRAASVGYSASLGSGAPVLLSSLRLRLFDADAVEQLGSAEVAGTVAVDAPLSGTLDLTPLNLPIGSYLAVLDARRDGASAWELLVTRSINVVDGLPPQVEWRLPLADAWVRRPSDLAALALDAHSGVERVEIALDGAGPVEVALREDGLYGGAFGGLADGAHRASVRALDRAGNESSMFDRDFRVDGTPPRIQIDGVSEGQVSNLPLTPLVTIVEENPASESILLDGSPYVSGTEVGVDGQHLLSVVAIDQAGNEARATRSFVLDRTPPEVQFVSPQDGDTITPAQIDVLLRTEALAQVELVVGAYAATGAADATGVARFPSVPLVIGANPMAATATDAVGNRGATATITVQRIDTSGSIFSGSLVPTEPTFDVGEEVLIDWQVLHQGGSARTGVPFVVRVVHLASQAALGEASFTLDLPAQGSQVGRSHFNGGGAALGAYVATLSVTDNGQVQQLAEASFQIADTNPPLISILHPSPGALLGAGIVVRAGIVDAETAVAAASVRIDGGAAMPMSAMPGTSHEYGSVPLDLADGAHVAEVAASDTAGNAATPQQVAFEVDRTPPEIRIGGVTDGERRNAPVVPTIEVIDAHLRDTQILLDGQPFVSATEVGDDGLHHLQVTATDQLDQQSQRELHFEIDRTPPVIAFTFPAEDAVLAVAETDVSGLSEANAVVDFELGADSATVVADALGGFVVPRVALAAGTNTFRARARDDLGNQSNWIERSVRYLPNAGAALRGDIAVPASVALGETLAGSYEVHNHGSVVVAALPARVQLLRVVDGDVVQAQSFVVDLAPGAALADALAFTTGDTLPGAHLVVLEALIPDAGGTSTWNLLASAAVEVLDVLPPQVEILEPAAGAVVDTGFRLRAGASDTHGNIASVQAQAAGGAWQAMTPEAEVGHYTTTIQAAVEGPLQLLARAEDDAGNQALSAPREVLVDLYPPRISISGVEESALYAHPVQAEITIEDIALATSSIRLDGVAYVSGVPISVDGIHVLEVTATDAIGRTSQSSRSFEIDTRPPVIQIQTPMDGATIAAAATLVAGVVDESFVTVTLTAGDQVLTQAIGSERTFQFANVPLLTGPNTLTAVATDRAGNIGAPDAVSVRRLGVSPKDVVGRIELTETVWANGDELPVPLRITNTGSDALLGLPVVFEVIDLAHGQTLAQLPLQFDVPSVASSLQTIRLDTHEWGLGSRHLALSVTLPGDNISRELDTHELDLVDREPPLLDVLQPVADGRVSPGAVVSLQASDRLSAIALVELRFDDGNWLAATPDAGAATQYVAAIPLLELGRHRLQARAFDAAGNVSPLRERSFIVIGELPLTVVAPIDGATTEPGPTAFSGSTLAGALVRIRLGELSWQGVADVSGRFQIDGVPIGLGENRFTAQAEDAFGNQSRVVPVLVIGRAVAGAPPPTPVPFHPIAWVLLIALLATSARGASNLRQGTPS